MKWSWNTSKLAKRRHTITELYKILMDYECSETGGNLKVRRESQSLCYF